MIEPIFSMGIDNRTRKQKQTYKRKRKHICKCKNKPTKLAFTPFTNTPFMYIPPSAFTYVPPAFSYIPDIPKDFEIMARSFLYDNGLLTCMDMIYLHNRTLTNIDKVFPPNNIWFTMNQLMKKWIGLHFKRRWAFRKLYNHYLYYKMRGRILNTMDPSTLCPIKNRVLVADMKHKNYYQFEAKSLQRQFDSVLGYNNWLFPEPGELKNPLTNQKFRNGQLLEIVRQLRVFQCTSWLIEAYVSTQFQNHIMKLYFNKPLSIYGIKEIVRNPSADMSLELIRDFIYEEFVINNASIRKRAMIKPLVWAVENIPSNPYIQEWLSYFKRYKIYEIFTRGGEEYPMEKKILELKGVLLFSDNKELNKICLLFNRRNGNPETT